MCAGEEPVGGGSGGGAEFARKKAGEFAFNEFGVDIVWEVEGRGEAVPFLPQTNSSSRGCHC